jgi:Tfp pilus assembly PilM family ATPase
MALLSNILGLDVGSHSLKAVEFRHTLRGFEAVAMRIFPRANSEAPLAELVQHFVRMHRLSTDHAVCALPGDRLSTRRLSFPFRDRKRLTQVVPFEIEADSLFDLDEVLVDWEIVGGNRNQAEVVATVATRADVSELLGTLREAQSEPRTLEAEGLVLCHLSTLFDLDGTRLLIDLGHRKTTCCLIADGQPVSARTFPVAGAALTEALARDRGLSADGAERAKCEPGVFASSALDTLPATHATLDRIAREIIRTLGALEPQIAKLESGPVVGKAIGRSGAGIWKSPDRRYRRDRLCARDRAGDAGYRPGQDPDGLPPG